LSLAVGIELPLLVIESKYDTRKEVDETGARFVDKDDDAGLRLNPLADATREIKAAQASFMVSFYL
jgi:hypothetical protein